MIVLTKADLVDDYSGFTDKVERAAPGVSTHVVSARTGYGLDELSAYLRPGSTVVFLGSSGVGKSSLVNALSDREIMAVGDIREEDDKGRHTTTRRHLLMLKCGAMIIDTPGMRELGMWGVSDGLGEAFADVESLFGKCRFHDCTHRSEPGCAIHAAIDSGELDAERWENYRALRSETEHAEGRSAYLQKKQQRGKNLRKAEKKRRKEIW